MRRVPCRKTTILLREYCHSPEILQPSAEFMQSFCEIYTNLRRNSEKPLAQEHKTNKPTWLYLAYGVSAFKIGLQWQSMVLMKVALPASPMTTIFHVFHPT